MRPFDNLEQMHDCMLTKHNERVKTGDIWYNLGDVTFYYGDEFASLFAKFNGRKRLIPGNHDMIKKLVPYFQKVQMWRVFKEEGMIPFTATHVPIDEESIKGEFNVHGHTHWNLHRNPRNYLNVCVERTDYAPRSFEDIQAEMKQRIDTYA